MALLDFLRYPHINELCQALHQRRISTFWSPTPLGGAKHGGGPAQPGHVVQRQLYVYIDAATKVGVCFARGVCGLNSSALPGYLWCETNKLLQEFWKRFLACLAALQGKGQRTVYRLTLIKSWDMKEVKEYVKLREVMKR